MLNRYDMEKQVAAKDNEEGLIRSLSTQQDHKREKVDTITGAQMSYGERCERTSNQFAKELFRIMETKQTNLCVSADLDTAAEILELAEQLGPQICMLKVHVDIIKDFSKYFISRLVLLANQHNFKIFADRKFADIGKTVAKQYAGGFFKIASWADLVNAHVVPGPGVIKGLKEGRGRHTGRGLLLLAEMSSAGNLCSPEYQQGVLAMANAHKDFVCGFISMRPLCGDPDFITMTPGVQFAVKGDALDQQYREPLDAVAEGSDVIIVGSGITGVALGDRIAVTENYRTVAWNAYLARKLPAGAQLRQRV